MEIVTTKAAMQKQAKELKAKGKSIGFVPTMGFLHDGHLNLVNKSVKANDITVMSIFVNPLQFGPNEDFDAYPRDPERDSKLAEAAGVDILFIPDVQEMYGDDLSLTLQVTKRTNVLCGKSRPGHFDGVVTVLAKLFNIILPDRAYFGLKDAQQVAVVDALIADLDFPVELVAVDTVREKDGLARSSRNVYLSEEERTQAPELFKSMKEAEKVILQGERDASLIVPLVADYIEKNTSGIIDYVEMLSYPDLLPIKHVQGKIIIAVAVQFSRARLIDNLILEVYE